MASQFLAVYDLAHALADTQVSRDLRGTSLLPIGVPKTYRFLYCLIKCRRCDPESCYSDRHTVDRIPKECHQRVYPTAVNDTRFREGI